MEADMKSAMRRDIGLEALAFVVGGHDGGGGCGRRDREPENVEHTEPAPVETGTAEAPPPEPYFEDGGSVDAITLDVHAGDLGYEDHVSLDDSVDPIATGHDDLDDPAAPADLDHDDVANQHHEDDYSSQGAANDTAAYEAHEDASSGEIAEQADAWSNGASVPLDVAASDIAREPVTSSIAYEASPRTGVSEWSYGDASVRLDVRSGG